MPQKPSNKKIAGQASRSFATKSRPGDLGQMGDHFGETWPKISLLLSKKYNEIHIRMYIYIYLHIMTWELYNEGIFRWQKLMDFLEMFHHILFRFNYFFGNVFHVKPISVVE